MKKVWECENISPKSSKMFRIFVFLFQNGQKGPKTLNSAILIITARLRILKVMFLYILTIRLGWLHQLSRVFLPRNSPTQPKSKKAIAYTINFSIQYYCILFYILNYSCMNKQNQHVVPHSNGWAVKTPNSERASRVFWTQKEATFYARERAQQNGSELFIHNREGKIRERNSYWKDPYPPKW